jgi:bifunctional enzyme CysN/CysC
MSIAETRRDVLPFPRRPRAAVDEEHDDPYANLGLLRFTTAGSVDDGKSTLIGRLLYDTKSIFEDQLEAVERASHERGDGYVNLALLTDGLRAEREQNITIDVAYRYFATPRRKFIIADTPGHLQYTRNMVTGASLAELAIVLVDARKGVQTQSKRHGFIASLLRIPHLVVAVNKMDLVDYDPGIFERIAAEYRAFAERLDVAEATFIPISALRGDNVVERSETMSWYRGPTLLEHLETVEVGLIPSLAAFRFPVQYVIRPHQDFRGLAGRVASGIVRPGDPVIAFPSGHTTRVRTVETYAGALEEGLAGESIVVTLEDELDVSRGGMLAARDSQPASATKLDATVCWMSDQPLDQTLSYVLMHTTRQVPARVTRLVHRIDVDTLDEHPTEALGLNDIARVHISTAEPIFFDPYDQNTTTGSFILIHPHTYGTVAAGMIRSGVIEEGVTSISPNVVWEGWNVVREERERRNGHGAAVLWFTGLSGAGKSTIARAVERRLFEEGVQTVLLDGDQLRHGLSGDLGFSEADRRENLRRVGEVARLFFETGVLVLAAFVSPYRVDRDRVRSLIPEGRFLEIHVDADLATCQARDPKGLYARALTGKIGNFTGVSAPYEIPENPELSIDTVADDVETAVREILTELRERGLIAPERPVAP